MTRADSRLSHVSNLLVIVTGLVYGALRLLYSPEDSDWSAIGHPLEPVSQKAHLLVIPVFLFSLGVTWKVHVSKKLNSDGEPSRISGIGMLSLAVPMIFSGIFLQVVSNEQVQDFMKWVHWITSILWSISYLIHVVLAETTLKKLPN